MFDNFPIKEFGMLGIKFLTETGAVIDFKMGQVHFQKNIPVINNQPIIISARSNCVLLINSTRTIDHDFVMIKKQNLNVEKARDGQSIVNMFKEYFSSVYTSPLPNPNSKHNFPNSIHNICNIDISLMDIFNELDNLNIHLCPGPDNISPKFLYNCRFILSYLIHYLFNNRYPQELFHLILK